MAPFRSQARILINADDFGLTAGVDRAIAGLAEAGVLRSATLMASGGTFQHAAALAHATPALQVGCHVLLVDGIACAPAGSIPSLADGNGNLRSSLAAFIFDLQRGRISENDIEAEACAQIGKLQHAGIVVTHVDTHKHTHLFPRVARPLMRAAVACGVRAIRNPFEQAWSANLTRGAFVRRFEVKALRGFQDAFRTLLRASNLRSTHGTIGVSATGTLDAATLQRLLDRAEHGTWELVCHPGYNDDELRRIKTRLRETRDTEREALLSVVPAALSTGRVDLIGFGDL